MGQLDPAISCGPEERYKLSHYRERREEALDEVDFGVLKPTEFI